MYGGRVTRTTVHCSKCDISAVEPCRHSPHTDLAGGVVLDPFPIPTAESEVNPFVLFDIALLPYNTSFQS